MGTGTAGTTAAELDRVHRRASARAALVAATAADRGIPTAVERDPVLAVGRAGQEADEAVPVVASGSSRLLAAVHGATVPQ